MPERARPEVPAGETTRRVEVAVDARGIHASGIGRFLREILKSLLADPRFGRVHLLGFPDELREFSAGTAEPGRVAIHAYPYGFYSPAAQLAWLRLRASGAAPADVYLFPHFDAPVLGLPRRSVVTVQDLIHFKVPEAFPWSKRVIAGQVMRRVVTTAGRVLVTSRSTLRDLAERVPGCERRVDVIPLGVDAEFWGEAPTDVAGSIAPDGPFLLCVGNRKPHKNLTAAVEVLARLRAERPELRLVVVGKEFPGADAVRARAEALGVADALLERSDVDDVRLRELYRRCEALLFPSLYEGFGLPILEAMAAGAPVVAANRASVPEVVGDAGLVADPDDLDAFAGAVRRLWSEPGLRDELIGRGRERARQLTWEVTGRRTADLLVRVAAGGGATASAPGPAPHRVHA